jgi:glycosyltransferase involved in cell wall biosynthesis
MIEISVVVPIRNEAPSLKELYDELTETFRLWGRSYELIVVDDGSTDQSFSVLVKLQRFDARLRIVRLRRNFGKTPALSAAFAAARGQIIVTLDGDLQMDPRDIPRLVTKLESDHLDVVCGWRRQRKDAFLSRRLPSLIANRLISWATGVRLHDYGCSLQVFRAEIVQSMRLYGELHRFIPALASYQGVTIAEMEVNHRPRRYGQSHYGISRTIRVVLDLLTVKFLTGFVTRPLQIFGALGLATFLPGIAMMGYLAMTKIVASQPIGGRPLLWFGFLFVVAGVQFLTLGLLAELQTRIYHESQDKPTYVIREVCEAVLPVHAPEIPRESQVPSLDQSPLTTLEFQD